MNAVEIIEKALSEGIYLYLKNSSLSLKAEKGAVSDELMSSIKKNKPAIIEYLQNARSSAENFSNDLPTISSRQDESILELSFAQQRLWFIDQLGGGSPEYNNADRFRLKGDFDASIFEKALAALLDRHEVLRTRFVAVNGDPRQVVDVDYTIPLTFHDLSSLCKIDQKKQVELLSEAEAAKPFDLSTDVMLRMRLLKLSNDDHILLQTVHHIASDGWSMGILAIELSQLYSSFMNNEVNPLPPLEIQYADFSLWQRQWLQGEVLNRQIDYWKQQLNSIPPTHSLPLDKARPSRLTFVGESIDQNIPGSALLQIKKFCDLHDVTLFMFLQTAFTVLVGRYSGTDDVVIGTPIAGRTHREVEKLIGFFVNALVIRTDLSGAPTFSELLRRNKQTILDAYDHQHIPFEMLVEEIQPERQMNHNPIIQVMFAVQNSEQVEINLAGLEFVDVEGDAPTEKIRFDLEVHVNEFDDRLSIKWVYNVDLFSESTIARMSDNYEVLLNSVIASLSAVEENQEGIGQLALLTNSEKQTVLHDWNDTSIDYPEVQSLHELFIRQVEKCPDNVAVRDCLSSLSYKDLYQNSKRIAFELSGADILGNELVGVAIDKSCSQIVAVMGILFSGAAYLPIDISWPMSRQNAVLSAGRCRIIISVEKISSVSDWGEKIEVVNVDQLELMQAEELDLHAIPQTPANDLAYVIFTSGSTGLPKGVMIEHGSAVNTIQSVNDQFDIGEKDSVLALASLSFDLSVYDVFGLLAVGGCIVLPKEEERVDPAAWYALLKKYEITLWDTVPGVFQMLIDYLEQEKKNENLDVSLPAFRLSLLSGDWLPVELPRQTKALLPSLDIISLGGATEASIWSNFYPIEDVTISRASIPYGKPLGNQRFYILDDALQSCPIGVAGYLYIGGKGLARGYWQDQEQTENSFIEHEGLKQRLYKTGDLGRWMPDGNIEFLGRKDSQVKIRGFRIELGEIEARLAELHSVQTCVVMAREDTPGDQRLVAYIVAEDNSAQDVGFIQKELKEHLQDSLPEYMVPSAYVLLDVLPLTSNGKVDRKALPAPEGEAYVQNEFVAPQSDLEILLCGIWRKLLKIESISIHDNFFELGGHSLLMLQLFKLIKDQIPMSITLGDLFQHSTIYTLAQKLEEPVRTDEPDKNPVLLRNGSENPLFFVHHPLGYTWNYIPLANLLPKNIPIYGLQLIADIVDIPNLQSIEDIASYHIKALKEVCPTGPYRVAGHSTGGIVAYEIAHQLHCNSEVVEFLGMIDTHAVVEFEQAQIGDDMQSSYLEILVLSYNPDLSEEFWREFVESNNGNISISFENAKKDSLIPRDVLWSDVVSQSELAKLIIYSASKYTPSPLPIVVHAFMAEESQKGDPLLGWEKLINDQWVICELGGSHASIMQSSYLQTIAKVMSEYLTREKSYNLSDCK